MRSILAVTIVIAAMTASASASLLMSDDFNAYTIGNLAGQGGWTAHSASGTNPVQVVPGTPPSDKEIQLFQGSGSREDVYKPLGMAMGPGDKWYAGFTVVVSGPVDSNDYFAHFFQYYSGQYYFPSKVGVTTKTGSDYTFYLHQGSGSGNPGSPSGTTQPWPTGFSFGTPHRLVVSYEYSTGLGELWVDPDCAAGPDGNPKITVVNSASALIEADRYAFRQGGNAAGSQLVDDVNVATTWMEACVPEPATIGLLAAGLMWVGRRRRAL